MNSNGMEFPATYQYELVSLDAESYVLDVPYDSPVDTEVDGTDVSGRISGTETITGAVDNRLEVSFEFEQDASISATDGGKSIDMQMSITIDNQVTSSVDATDAGDSAVVFSDVPAATASPDDAGTTDATFGTEVDLIAETTATTAVN